MSPPRLRRDARDEDKEVVCRLAAARVVIDAVLCGLVIADPQLLDALRRLIDSATRL